MAGNKGERCTYGQSIHCRASLPPPLSPRTPLLFLKHITPLSTYPPPLTLLSAALTHHSHPNMVRMRVGSQDCLHSGGIATGRCRHQCRPLLEARLE
jgi:hypothetical protein